MRLFILFLFFLGSLIDPVSAQIVNAKEQAIFQDPDPRPLIFVDSFKTDIYWLVLNPMKIDSIEVFEDTSAISKYGDAGKNGVVVIHLKRDSKMLRLWQMLEKFQIPKDDRSLRVCINKTPVPKPELILVEQSEIEKVEITTDWHWMHPQDANTGERFINIVRKSRDG